MLLRWYDKTAECDFKHWLHPQINSGRPVLKALPYLKAIGE